jgi:hypothetical protein
MCDLMLSLFVFAVILLSCAGLRGFCFISIVFVHGNADPTFNLVLNFSLVSFISANCILWVFVFS